MDLPNRWTGTVDWNCGMEWWNGLDWTGMEWNGQINLVVVGVSDLCP